MFLLIYLGMLFIDIFKSHQLTQYTHVYLAASYIATMYKLLCIYYREFAKRQLEGMKKNGKKGNCIIV